MCVCDVRSVYIRCRHHMIMSIYGVLSHLWPKNVPNKILESGKCILVTHGTCALCSVCNIENARNNCEAHRLIGSVGTANEL